MSTVSQLISKIVSRDTALLFGSVEPSHKGRVREAVIKGLSQGKREGRFESVPGSKGCYTLLISLLEAPEGTSQP